jgi:hypothetical protein
MKRLKFDLNFLSPKLTKGGGAYVQYFLDIVLDAMCAKQLELLIS